MTDKSYGKEVINTKLMDLRIGGAAFQRIGKEMMTTKIMMMVTMMMTMMMMMMMMIMIKIGRAHV